MKRSAIVIAATAAGLALTLSFRPHSTGATSATLATLTTGTPAVAGAQTVVGSDQALAGGLGDIQVKVTAANGKIVSVGMAKMNLHGPQSSQISNNVIPQLEQQAMAGGAQPKMRCPNCKQDVPVGSKFCPNCGYNLDATVKCSKCGTTAPADSKFCPNCGNTMGAAPAGQEAAAGGDKAEEDKK